MSVSLAVEFIHLYTNSKTKVSLTSNGLDGQVSTQKIRMSKIKSEMLYKNTDASQSGSLRKKSKNSLFIWRGSLGLCSITSREQMTMKLMNLTKTFGKYIVISIVSL